MEETRRIDLETCAQMLKQAQDVLVYTHLRPDGDTTGSAAALCYSLRKAGKKAYVLHNADLTPRYEPIVSALYPPEGFTAGFVIAVDTADVSLLCANPEGQAFDLVIDHHVTNTNYARYNYVCGNVSSTGEAVYDALVTAGLPVDGEILRALFISVSTDTGCFRYSNTTSRAHVIAANAIEAGVDTSTLTRIFFEDKSRARFELERLMLDQLEFYNEGRIVVVTVTLDMLEQTQATDDDMDNISAIARQINGVDAGVTIFEKCGFCKISLRTSHAVNASDICFSLGGGGHARAAGCRIDGDVGNAKKTVLEALGRYFALSE